MRSDRWILTKWSRFTSCNSSSTLRNIGRKHFNSPHRGCVKCSHERTLPPTADPREGPGDHLSHFPFLPLPDMHFSCPLYGYPRFLSSYCHLTLMCLYPALIWAFGYAPFRAEISAVFISLSPTVYAKPLREWSRHCDTRLLIWLLREVETLCDSEIKSVFIPEAVRKHSLQIQHSYALLSLWLYSSRLPHWPLRMSPPAGVYKLNSSKVRPKRRENAEWES